MGVFPLGDQRVGIERLTVTGYTDYNEPITTSVTVWVDRSCFEIQTQRAAALELQAVTVTTSEIAWAVLPIADGAVPAVNDADDPAPVRFFDDDGKPTINSSAWLWHNGLRYAMRGDAVLEQDIRAREDHVFCVCERERG